MRTLFPVQGETPENLEPFMDGPPYGRYKLEIPTDVVLQDDWQQTTVDGRAVWVRRADCGAGCRCAGEFTFREPRRANARS